MVPGLSLPMPGHPARVEAWYGAERNHFNAVELAMLGPPKSRRLDAPIAVSLEDLVPRDHFYRHLDATLDLGFVREWTRELYADRGRPGIDPVVFFKLQLVMFFEGLRS